MEGILCKAKGWQIIYFMLIPISSLNTIILLPQNDHNIRIVTIPAKRSFRVEVSKVSTDFNGVYQCIVNNEAGSDTHTFDVFIKGEG